MKLALESTTSVDPQRGSPILRDSLRLLAAGALGVGAVLALLPAGGHDQLWCLYVAGRLLDGVRLYGPQIFESNPPLIMWLSCVPVAFARVLHVEPSFTAKLLVCAALAAILSLSRRILADVATRFPFRIEALLLFFTVAYFCIPARDFGQREHLLSFLVLPYLLLAASGINDTFLRLIAGVLAGVGICLKPQQALVPLFVEIELLLRNRSLRTLRRPEPWMILGICVGYVGLIRAATPEYFSTILPVLRETYWAIGHLSPLQLLAASLQLQVLLLAALAGYFALCKQMPPEARAIIPTLLAAAAAGDLAYLQQGTGWYYQQLPAIVFSLAALFVLAAVALGGRQLRLPPVTRPAFAWLAVVATFLTLHFSDYPVTRDRAYAITTPDPALFRGLAPGTGIAIFTTSVDEAMMPVSRYHLFWAQRTNNLWWMPALLRSEAGEAHALWHLHPPQLERLAALQRSNMAEDLERWNPSLILIERCQDAAVRCQVIEDLSPDLLAWFEQDRSFRAAFAPYTRTTTDGRFDVYRRRMTPQ